MILINFKIYKETFGDRAIELAKIVKEIGDKHKIRTIITTSALDAVRVKNETGAEIWLQNVDEFTDGKHSGWVSAEQAMALGIKGSLLNHSEHKIAKGKMAKILKHKPAGFEIMVCVGTVGQIRSWTNKLKPEWILFEPPALIASTDKSVATEEPEMIGEVVKAAGKIPVIIGAGVKSQLDTKTALKLGAKGVMLASAFVTSKNPKELLEEIASGFDAII